MGLLTFNIAKGRTVEYHSRVVSNDPANSALILVVLAHATIESDDVLRDYDTLAAVLATSLEVTNANYARKVLTDADLTAPVVDDANDYVTLTFATQTYTAIGVGSTWSKLLVCYDSDTTAGTDANIVPMYGHDLRIQSVPVIPTGANIVISLPNGYARAR